MAMRKIADRTYNSDVKFDEATGKWKAQKELSVIAEFSDETEAINWSKEPIDAETPISSSKPAKMDMQPGPVQAPVNVGGDELDLSDLEVDLGEDLDDEFSGDDLENELGDYDEESEKAPTNKEASRRARTRFAEVTMNPGKVSRVRDSVEKLLWNSAYDSVRNKWVSTASDEDNLEKILNDPKVSALDKSSEPSKRALYSNLMSLRSRITHQRENSNQGRRVTAGYLYPSFDKIVEAGELTGAHFAQVQGQLINFARRQANLSLAQADDAITEYRQAKLRELRDLNNSYEF